MIFLAAYWGNAFAPYQKARIQAVFSNSGDAGYLTATLRSILTANKFAGNSGVDVTEMLPAYNADYILAYLLYVWNARGDSCMLHFSCVDSYCFSYSHEAEESVGHDDGMWHDISCKLSDKCIGKCRSISTGSNIYAIFICRRKLSYCFLWINGYYAEHIQIQKCLSAACQDSPE